jgi:hypothetical protein
MKVSLSASSLIYPTASDVHSASRDNVRRTRVAGTPPTPDPSKSSVNDQPANESQLLRDHLSTSFVSADATGTPTGFESASAAKRASWETQGRFFHFGKPVDGNLHAREFDFPDGSKLVIKAYTPLLTDSDNLRARRPFTPSAPHDRIWQGYKIECYEKGSDTPSDTRYMYAWDSDPYRVQKFAELKDPATWIDYADASPDGIWDWWKWNAGDAPLRAPEVATPISPLSPPAA